MSKSKEIELKPCPFCGKPARQWNSVFSDGVVTGCNSAKCEFTPRGLRRTAHASARLWNTRKEVKA